MVLYSIAPEYAMLSTNKDDLLIKEPCNGLLRRRLPFHIYTPCEATFTSTALKWEVSQEVSCSYISVPRIHWHMVMPFILCTLVLYAVEIMSNAHNFS